MIIPKRYLSTKQIEAETFVDACISKNGYPPTYRQVAIHLKLSNTAAYARLKHCRSKMKPAKEKSALALLKVLKRIKGIGPNADMNNMFVNFAMREYAKQEVENAIKKERGV